MKRQVSRKRDIAPGGSLKLGRLLCYRAGRAVGKTTGSCEPGAGVSELNQAVVSRMNVQSLFIPSYIKRQNNQAMLRGGGHFPLPCSSAR